MQPFRILFEADRGAFKFRFWRYLPHTSAGMTKPGRPRYNQIPLDFSHRIEGGISLIF